MKPYAQTPAEVVSGAPGPLNLACETVALDRLIAMALSPTLKRLLQAYKAADVTGRTNMTDDDLYTAENAADELQYLAADLAEECCQAIRYVRRRY